MDKKRIKEIVNCCCGRYECAKCMLKTLSDDERIELKATLKQKCVHSTKWLDIGVAFIMFVMAYVSLQDSLHIPYLFGWIISIVTFVAFVFILIAHMICKYKEGKRVKTLTYIEEFEKSLTK